MSRSGVFIFCPICLLMHAGELDCYGHKKVKPYEMIFGVERECSICMGRAPWAPTPDEDSVRNRPWTLDLHRRRASCLEQDRDRLSNFSSRLQAISTHYTFVHGTSLKSAKYSGYLCPLGECRTQPFLPLLNYHEFGDHVAQVHKGEGINGSVLRQALRRKKPWRDAHADESERPNEIRAAMQAGNTEHSQPWPVGDHRNNHRGEARKTPENRTEPTAEPAQRHTAPRAFDQQPPTREQAGMTLDPVSQPQQPLHPHGHTYKRFTMQGSDAVVGDQHRHGGETDATQHGKGVQPVFTGRQNHFTIKNYFYSPRRDTSHPSDELGGVFPDRQGH
ncbi:MAG: hypothetical protein Q9162_005006 [Coniocarpon cinnabarinum]